MDKQDWIILRLLHFHHTGQAAYTRDWVRACTYLWDKYGKQVMFECIDQLNAEKRHDKAIRENPKG